MESAPVETRKWHTPEAKAPLERGENKQPLRRKGAVVGKIFCIRKENWGAYLYFWLTLVSACNFLVRAERRPVIGISGSANKNILFNILVKCATVVKFHYEFYCSALFLRFLLGECSKIWLVIYLFFFNLKKTSERPTPPITKIDFQGIHRKAENRS